MNNQAAIKKKYREKNNRCTMELDGAMRDRFDQAAQALSMSKAEAFELCTKYLEKKCKKLIEKA